MKDNQFPIFGLMKDNYRKDLDKNVLHRFNEGQN
jgi:hypothetical protein